MRPGRGAARGAGASIVAMVISTARAARNLTEPPLDPLNSARMGNFVYLLRCADGSLYCGWTTDLAKRLTAHNAGTGSRYVTRRRPARIAAAWEAADRSAAMSLEARIKRLPRSEKLRLVDGAPLEGAARLDQ